MSAETFRRRLKLSSILIAAGLIVEVVTLFWSHPLTFIAFLGLGGALVVLGVLLYLYALVSQS